MKERDRETKSDSKIDQKTKNFSKQKSIVSVVHDQLIDLNATLTI